MSELPHRRKEDDPRFLRTRKALLDTIITLVDQAPDQPISITKLVEIAGVTRPTFYQHFPDVSSAVQRAAMDRIESVIPPYSGDVTIETIGQTVTQHVLPSLQHIASNRAFYLRVIDSAANATFFDELVHFVRQRMLSTDEPIIAPAKKRQLDAVSDVIAGGSMWLVVRWIRGDLEGTPQELAQRLADVARILYLAPTCAEEGR